MQAGGLGQIPTLPTMKTGVHLLEQDDGVRAAMHSLVVDHLLIHDGEVLWADSQGHARTRSLLRIAPSRRTLERIRVARAFTAFQHQSTVSRLGELVTPDTALVVVPALDYHYRSEDLARGEPERMMEATVDRIETIADHQVAVLVTRTRADDLTAPLERLADERIRVEATRFGPRFVRDEVETLVYRDHEYVQTTLAFWSRVLEERQQARERIRRAVVA